MPSFFCNNLLPAKAVFAHFVMGLYATKIWGGQTGFGHGTPFAWIYSSGKLLAPLDAFRIVVTDFL